MSLEFTKIERDLKEKKRLEKDMEALVLKIQTAFPNAEITQEKVLEMLKFIKQKTETEYSLRRVEISKNRHDGFSYCFAFLLSLLAISEMLNIDIVNKYALLETSKEEKDFLLKIFSAKFISLYGVSSVIYLISLYLNRRNSKKEKNLKLYLYKVENIRREFKNAGITEGEIESIVNKII
jgi:hypothetical protein